jgi:TolB-like protein
MAFEPPAESTLTDIADVATLLLADFGSDPAFSVVGPSTTIRFATSEEPLVGAIRELNVRYIINGRFIRRDDRDQVLVELVRTSDGAHIWVQMYDDTHSAATIAEQVSIHVRDVLRAGDHPVS